MAKSRIWARDLANGTLPKVCIVTGEPTEDSLRFSFATSPPWVLVFLVIGLIGYAIAASVTAKRAAGRLPLVARKHRVVMLMRWGGFVTIIAGIVLVFAAAFVSPHGDSAGNPTAGALVLLGCLLIVGGIVWVLVRSLVAIRGRVESAPGSPDNWVTLSPVSPAFAEAVARMYAERAAAAATQPAAYGGYTQPYA